jgi:hypothetical protein
MFILRCARGQREAHVLSPLIRKGTDVFLVQLCNDHLLDVYATSPHLHIRKPIYSHFKSNYNSACTSTKLSPTRAHVSCATTKQPTNHPVVAVLEQWCMRRPLIPTFQQPCSPLSFLSVFGSSGRTQRQRTPANAAAAARKGERGREGRKEGRRGGRGGGGGGGGGGGRKALFRGQTREKEREKEEERRAAGRRRTAKAAAVGLSSSSSSAKCR